jgi:pantetheine-phosphate adenylyltransferase
MASGKGELARFLKRLNFSYISLSDMVRETANQKGQKNISRQDMQNIGNQLRQQGGPGILAKRVREKINSTKKKTWIIDGIRNPEEVVELKKLPHFYLIGVKSDLEVLLKRLNSRNRETDQAQPSELKQVLRREWGNGEPAGGQQVGQSNGHIDIIERGLKIFDRIIVAALKNPSKTYLLSLDERLEIIRETFAQNNRIDVDYFEGLLVDYLKKQKLTTVVRGLRAISDFDIEFQMALINRSIAPQIETIFFVPSVAYSFLSSKLVKEIYLLGGEIKQMVPAIVDKKLKQKFKQEPLSISQI